MLRSRLMFYSRSRILPFGCTDGQRSSRALCSLASWSKRCDTPATFTRVRCMELAGPAGPRQPAFLTAASFSTSVFNRAKDRRPSTGQEPDARSSKQSHSTTETAEVSQPPKPERMWNAVPDDESSADTGGYIKLQDIGFDEKEIDEVRSRENADFLESHKDKVEDKKSSRGPSAKAPEKSTKDPERSKADDKQRPEKPAAGKAAKDKLDDIPSEKKSGKSAEKQNADRPEKEKARDVSRLSESGSASSDSAGIEQLTEQLVDREKSKEKYDERSKKEDKK